jgi:hypothetical protein
MPILTFPTGHASAGRKQYVLHRISDGVILGRNRVYPVATDDAPISGLDPDLEYLAMNQDVKPDVDLRIFSLSISEGKATEAPHLDDTRPTWHISWTATRLPNDTIKVHARNAQAAANALHYTPSEKEQISLLGLGLAARKHAGLELNIAEEALDARITELYPILFANDQRLAEIYTEIENDENPDLDAGWEPAP